MLDTRTARAAALAVALAPALLLGACGGNDDDVEVRSFDEVRDGEVVFEPDPSDPTRAIMRVETTEPMICAIVWGEDEAFGRFNNSLAMNGTGITDHDVLLPEVEGDISYSYVIQGTTADGTLYRSDVGTFSIDPQPADTAPTPDFARGDNLALDATVTEASSEFSGAFAAEHAIDGDTATEWATAGDGDDGSITIDLGSERQIVGIDFVTRSMADGSSITDTYTVTVDDGRALGPFAAGTAATPRPSQVDATGRALRFDVDSSTGGNVGAVEIRIYAATSPD